MAFPRKAICAATALALSLGITPGLALASDPVGLTAATVDAQSSEPVTATIATNYDVDGTTLLNSADYTKYLSYHDDLTNQIGWGAVQVAWCESDGVRYWFVTDPDPAHAQEVQCTLVDFDTAKDNVTLDIPGTVEIDINRDGSIGSDEVFTTTAVGYVSGSNYLTPNNPETNVVLDSQADDKGAALDVDKHDVRYWYASVNEFVPSWAISDSAQSHVVTQHKKEKAFVDETYAKQHPFLDGGGSNNTLFAPQYCNRNTSWSDNTLLVSPASLVSSVVCPASVRSIASYSFAGCSGLKNVSFAEDSQLETCGQGWLASTSVTSLMLPDSFKRLDSVIYKTNAGITRDDYTKAVSEKWDNFIDSDGNFITINDTDKLVQINQASGGALALASSIENLSFPASALFDETSKTANTITAFANLNNLKSLEMRGSSNKYQVLDNILYNADATQMIFVPACLSSAILSDTISSEGLGTAFQNKTELRSITLGSGITTIPVSAFQGCSSLADVAMGDGITAIGASAFKGCSSLERIELSASLTTLGNFAFQDCDKLTSIVFPNGLTSLGSNTFQGCSALESVILPSGIKTITSAFCDCNNLKQIISQSADTVTIDKSAFSGCTSLSRIVLYASKVTMNSGVNNKGKKFATPFAGAAWAIDSGGAVDNLTLVFPNEVTEIDFNDTFNDSNVPVASGEHTPYFLAKQLTICGLGDVLKGYFVDENGSINGNNVSLHYASSDAVAVTYVDICDKIVKIGAGAASATMAGVPAEAVAYTGSAIEPVVTVTYGTGENAVTLEEDTDFTLSYADNMKPGTATVTVTGMGDYVGTLSATFTIADTEDSQAAADEAAVQDFLADVAALPGAGEIGADSTDAIAAVDAAVGAYVAMNDAQKADVDVATLQKLVEAQAKVAEIKAAALAQAESDLTAANGTIGQLQDDLNAANAQAEALKDDLKKANEAAQAQAASASLAKAQLAKGTKSKKKGKVTVAWSKVDGADGYEVKVGAKTYTVKGGAKLSKTAKAKKGKKVKVQVRAYKKVGDNTLYGPWSAAKKVKVKK